MPTRVSSTLVCGLGFSISRTPDRHVLSFLDRNEYLLSVFCFGVDRGRQNSTDWMHNPRAFDIAEPLIWQEFYRRKLERESMTVHA